MASALKQCWRSTWATQSFLQWIDVYLEPIMRAPAFRRAAVGLDDALLYQRQEVGCLQMDHTAALAALEAAAAAAMHRRQRLRVVHAPAHASAIVKPRGTRATLAAVPRAATGTDREQVDVCG